MNLERTAYVSDAIGAASSLNVIVDILATSQRNNDREGITGALASDGERFFQVIEGPPHALDALMARVATDPRHANVRVVQREPVEGRLFGDWSMTMPRIRPEMLPKLRRVIAESERSPNIAIDLLLSLANEA